MSDFQLGQQIVTREQVLEQLVGLQERIQKRSRAALELIVMETTRPGRTIDAVKTLDAIRAIAEEALR